jgi:hypothetical protein
VLSRPGFKTSEFIVGVLTFLGLLGNAAQDWTSTHDAALFSVPALVFILSRGLAKYEQRGSTG